jgi:hypothetical protein
MFKGNGMEFVWVKALINCPTAKAPTPADIPAITSGLLYLISTLSNAIGSVVRIEQITNVNQSIAVVEFSKPLMKIK